MNSWIHDVDFDDSYAILIKYTSLSLLRLEAAMKTEKENMRSTLDSILAKVNNSESMKLVIMIYEIHNLLSRGVYELTMSC